MLKRQCYRRRLRPRKTRSIVYYPGNKYSCYMEQADAQYAADLLAVEDEQSL